MEVIHVSKGVGVALWTTKLSNARVRLATFLLITKHKVYINGILNNTSFQQSKLETVMY